jgi:class 3 adenylate cyclase
MRAVVDSFRAPRTRYARSGDLDIAWQQAGESDIDLVVVPGFLSHVELNWEWPPVRNVYVPLLDWARLLMFDKRGTGLSDRSIGVGSMSDRMDDIRAVMDAANVERAHLFGISEGGPLSILFAAAYPDRVQSLTLYGTFARATAAEGYDAPEVDEEAILEQIESAWGTGYVLEFFTGTAPDPERGRAENARFERNACTPRVAADVMRSNFAIDVRDVLPLISTPTLVAHYDDDPVVAPVCGEYLAANIPDAKHVVFHGRTHASWRASDYDGLLAAVYEHVTGQALPTRAERVLATVLFTDIVSSTEVASRLGDREWHDVLDEHDRLAADTIQRHDGRLVAHTGDGLVATFETPARAIRAAQTMRELMRGLGCEIRAGMHAGEVERRGDNVSGIAVHVAARVEALATPGEILVSRTVADLVAGSDHVLDDRGEHELKGVDGTWRVLAVAS